MKFFQKQRFVYTLIVYTLILAVSLSSTVFGAQQPTKSVTAAKEYSEYAVHYWTLRRMKLDEIGAVTYNSELGPGTGGILTATVPYIHEPGHIERPRVFQFFSPEDPKKHITIKPVRPTSDNEFFDSLNQRVAESPNKSVLVMIHGYDYHFAEAAYRAGQFLHDSGFDGTLVMFTWPSFGEFGENGYFADIEHAMISMPGLADFLDELPKAVPEANISILAHSLGCRIVCNALTQLDVSHSEGNGPQFDQLILAAADIDYKTFVRVSADAVRRSSIGVTVYVSQTDFALQISGDYRNNRRRLGDANGESVVLEGIDVVDATNAESQDGADFGHTGHMYPFISIEIMQDIVEIIRGLPVDQRSFTSGRVISTIQSH